MRRAAVKATAFRARSVIVATFFFALLVLASTLAAPVAAQDETTAQSDSENRTVARDRDASSGEPRQSVQGGGQQADDATGGGDEQDAARVADPLQDAEVTIESTDGMAESIEIAAADCDVEKGATVTVADGSGNDPVTFVNLGDAAVGNVEAVIEPTRDRIVIDELVTDSPGNFGAEDSEDGEVTDSTGITCGRAADDGDAAEDGDGEDGDANGGDAAADDGETAEDLRDLSCDELLVLFRAEGSAQQYEDASGFADSGVRAQIEVCLKREIVEGTAAEGDLPDTGGLSLLGLAVLGVVSVAAGLSVIRGGRR